MKSIDSRKGKFKPKTIKTMTWEFVFVIIGKTINNNSENYCLKDTYRKNILSNKTQVLTNGMNMDICVIGTLNQLFLRGLYTPLHLLHRASS